MTSIEDTARALVTAGKGILAAHESTPTMAKRLDAVGLTSTEEVRRDYREILFTTPDLAEHISGVILYDETIRQHASDGRSFVHVVLGSVPPHTPHRLTDRIIDDATCDVVVVRSHHPARPHQGAPS